MPDILKGFIYITDNLDAVYNFPVGPTGKIINLDEDGILPENENVIGGTCLLPPMAAKIAEADGNEALYDEIYKAHLLEIYQLQFISALLAYLYKGGNLLLFLPELGYTNTMDKLIQFMQLLYGIHIGKIGSNNPNDSIVFYDLGYSPMWLNLLYNDACIINAYEFLYLFPEDANINNNPRVMERLINDIRPVESTLYGKIEYIIHLHKQIHKNKNTIPAIRCIV